MESKIWTKQWWLDLLTPRQDKEEEVRMAVIKVKVLDYLKIRHSREFSAGQIYKVFRRQGVQCSAVDIFVALSSLSDEHSLVQCSHRTQYRYL